MVYIQTLLCIPRSCTLWHSLSHFNTDPVTLNLNRPPSHNQIQSRTHTLSHSLPFLDSLPYILISTLSFTLTLTLTITLTHSRSNTQLILLYSLSHSLPHSLAIAPILTPFHSHSLTPTPTLAHNLNRTHSQFDHSHTRFRSPFTLILFYTYSHTPSYTHFHTYSQSHTHSHPNTHIHTRSHFLPH